MPYSKQKHSEEEIRERRRNVLRRYAEKHRDQIRAKRRRHYERYKERYREWRQTDAAQKYFANYRREHDAERKEYGRNKRLVTYYGITSEERDRMQEAVGGRCEVCRVNKATHVDHCHATGKIRGLVCHKCNAGIGMLGDNLEGVKQALDYLQKQTNRKE